MTTSTAIAAEFRAALGRQGLTQGQLARRIGHNDTWVSARIGRKATVNITIDEVVEMAEALGVDPERLVLDALRARRDSNPKPSDLVLSAGPRSVNRALTAFSRVALHHPSCPARVGSGPCRSCGSHRSEWVLAS